MGGGTNYNVFRPFHKLVSDDFGRHLDVYGICVEKN